MSETSGVPNKTQQKFIREKLVPFILREQGRGFAMNEWLATDLSPSEELEFDGVDRKIPVCGTVCCIGGSTEFLSKRINWKSFDPRERLGILAKKLGITHAEAAGLFYAWNGDPGDMTYFSEVGPHAWPKTFAERFYKADTPYKKARVAALLLLKIAKEGGKCLHVKAV